MLVAPALHVHPATDTLLRYLSPAIEWQLVALDERWRGRAGGVSETPGGRTRRGFPNDDRLKNYQFR